MNQIVNSLSPVTLVGGGKLRRRVLDHALAHAPVVVAADGGAASALKAGIVPQAVIGDFDSLDKQSRERIPEARLHRIAEQDTTDFDKCLKRISAPLIIGVGFGGGRIDHQLAAYHGLMRHPDRSCVLLGHRDLVFLAPSSLALDLPTGTRFSLFPMASVRARSKGLRWPLDNVEFAPGIAIGTSNEALGPLEIEVERAGMLCILPATHLNHVVEVLLKSDQPVWPVSAVGNVHS